MVVLLRVKSSLIPDSESFLTCLVARTRYMGTLPGLAHTKRQLFSLHELILIISIVCSEFIYMCLFILWLFFSSFLLSSPITRTLASFWNTIPIIDLNIFGMIEMKFKLNIKICSEKSGKNLRKIIDVIWRQVTACLHSANAS